MKLSIAVFTIFLIVSLSFSCRKKDCTNNIIKTDELSNTTWLGAYGRKTVNGNIRDTIFVLVMKQDGFLNVYRNRDTAKNGIEGKGFYTFDGTAFKANFTIFKIGYPYILEGKINEAKTMISGSLQYNINNLDGIFEMVPVTNL